MANNTVFMEFIQLHERQWGLEQYPGRPSLAQLVQYPIVAMWTAYDKRSSAAKRVTSGPEADLDRFMLTAHQNYEELDQLATSIIVSGSSSPAPSWKLVRLFVEQKPVKVIARLQIIDE